ncbi:MAG: phosphate acyltransferase PlsX [Erysipelotrichaceae bacterium]|nr:phosphate acyltransferase PlsX [Erysipelotrichaceae bacterium]
MRIAIDAMGNDNGSQVFVDAIKMFLHDFNDVNIVVYGKEEEFLCFKDQDNIEIIDCHQYITMDDGLLAVKRKIDSSMSKILTDLAENRIDGVVSAGSTGALLTLSIAKIKTISTIERPCLLATVPSTTDRVFQYLDMGANSDTSAHNIHQFALMGQIYSKIVFKVEHPHVRLLNIGVEKGKGDKLHKEAFELLNNDDRLIFGGNIEGRDMFNGEADVIVTDGFSGNMTLKAIEGTAHFAFDQLKSAIYSSTLSKIAGLLLKKTLVQVKDKLDYSRYGGAVLIGLEKPVVKAHGSSNAKAIYNALIRLHVIIKNDTINILKRELQ